MVGDRDGVVVVPRHDAAAVLIALERIRSYETARLEAIAAAISSPGLDRLLVDRGASSSMLLAMPGDRNRLLGAGYAARIQLACWREIRHRRDRRVEPQRGTARTLAAELGVPSFDELDVLLNHPAVDAVDIATAVETHRDYAAGGGIRQACPLSEAAGAELRRGAVDRERL